MDKIINIFLKEKPSLILLALNKNNNIEKTVSCLVKDADSVFAHVTNTISSFKKENIVTSKKMGRKKIITLTEKGKQLAKLLEEVLNISYNSEENDIELQGGKK